MLVQARRRKLDGVDAVIGVVETHGRVETDLLTKGIETVPKKRMPYKGRVLAEMDLDAILQRRPRLVLVDELAHDNAPGSRHPKRYLDVEELLAAGIDVYTTLNVQHIESLNDVVAKITHVRVRETVPDSILDRADDIELVDLTPEDLLQRLKDGKVYMPDAAERAQQNYFAARQSGGAARTGAAPHRPARGRADGGLYARPCHRRALGSGRTAAGGGECHGPARPPPIRQARRLADRLRAPWTAMHVETGAAERSRARPRRPGPAPGRAHGRRGRHRAGRQRSRRRAAVRPRQQCHPYRRHGRRAARAGARCSAPVAGAADRSAAPAT